MKAIQFKNFSTDDFTWSYDGIAYTFPAGATMFLEDYKAEHFAKHLVDRELTKKGVATDMKVQREQMLSECFPSTEEITPSEALNIEARKTVKKVSKKKVEEEFEDLNND